MSSRNTLQDYLFNRWCHRNVYDRSDQRLRFFITQTTNPGEGRNTKLVFTDMPTSDTGLEPGTLYRIGNDVKISLLNIAVLMVTRTTSLGTVTVSVS